MATTPHKEDIALATTPTSPRASEETVSQPAEGPRSPAGEAPATFGKWNTRLRYAACLLLPVYLETLDYTVVATAQPHIASYFDKLNIQSWIGTSYILTSTVFLPIYASIADTFGRHLALQFALGCFIIGSVLCTAAQNMVMFLIGRGISGVGAAGFVSVVRIILGDSQSLKEDNFLSSLLIVLLAVGYCTGPVIGGALIDVSFRWIFAINLPTCVLSSLLVFFILRPVLKPAQPSRRLKFLALPGGSTHKETGLQKVLRIDWVGTILFVVGGIFVLLALSLGSGVEKQGFKAPIVIASFVVGFVLIGAMVAWQYVVDLYIKAAEDELNNVVPRRHPAFAYRCPRAFRLTEPMMPLVIFKNYDVSVCNFAAMTGGMVLFACFYFLAIYYQIVRGMTPTKAGIQLLYWCPGTLVGVVLAMRMTKFFLQAKYSIILGAFFTLPAAVGLISMAIKNNNPTQLSGFLVLAGFGIGSTFMPLMLQSRFSQPQSRVALTVSMNMFFRTAGGTIGLAQLSAVLNSKVKTYITAALTNPSYSLTPAQKSQIAGVFGADLNSLSGILNLEEPMKSIVQDSFRLACRWSFISLIPWVCASGILCWGLKLIPRERVMQGWTVGQEGDKTMQKTSAEKPVEA